MTIINLGGMAVNNWLVGLKEGYLLIDTGYPARFGRFYTGLRRRGIDISEIRYVFLTHAHADHAGFLGALLQNSSARAVVHERAVSALRKGRNSQDYFYTSAAGAAAGRLAKLGGRDVGLFTPIPAQLEDRYIIIDGKQEDKRLSGQLQGRVIGTPGHTDCSISLLTEDGELFCGDAAMNGAPSLNRVSLVLKDLDSYVESWRKIIELRPEKIYPGHGSPFDVSDLKKYMYVARQTKLYPPKAKE